MATFDLTSYQALSFDIYGTLMNWEAALFERLVVLSSRVPKDHEIWKWSLVDIKAHLIGQYNVLEHKLETEYPGEKYSKILAMVYEKLAADLGVSSTKAEAEAFGGTIGEWPAFPDTVAAMQKLGKYYKLIALSNVDKASFSETLSGPLKDVRFDAVCVAEDIGSYKPDLRNFEYLVNHIQKDFGIEKDGICHTANSLFIDHIPTAAAGFRPTVWISRGKGDMLEAVKDKVNLGAIYETLGDMAAAVEEAFESKKAA